MRALIQRVTWAAVSVEGRGVGVIGPGIVLLLGVGKGDTEVEADYVADKCLDLRIFADPITQKPDRSVRDIAGGVLVVSQFTLYGQTAKGRRPDFLAAAEPERARMLYVRVVERIRATGLETACGVFGASMQVKLVNDGPFTLWVEREAPRPSA